MKKISNKISMWLTLVLIMATVLSDAGTLVTKAAETDNGIPKEAFSGGKYDDVNTLGATVTVKKNILKAKVIRSSNEDEWDEYKAQTVKPAKVVVNGTTLKPNRDYTVSYLYDPGSFPASYDADYKGWKMVTNVAEPGTYRMCVIGKGDYSGVCVKRIYVYDPAYNVPITDPKFKININKKMSYTGKPITEGVIESVTYKNPHIGMQVLEDGDDYNATYLNNVDTGTGIVRVTGDLGFVGEVDIPFQITGGTKINKAKVTGVTAKTYDCGNAVTQDMSRVKVTLKGKELVYGTDYAVAYYMNNKKAGTAKMVITGKGLYYGTITKTFKINKVKLNKDMLDKSSRSIMVKYTKKAVKPDVTIYNDEGEPLVKNVDYTLSYKNNVKISEKAVITVKGKGNYTGSFKVNFTITDKDIVEQPDEDGKPSEGSNEGEKPSEGSDEGKTDEGEKPSEGSGEGEKPGEGSNEGEKPGEDSSENKPAVDNGESGESKPDDNGTDDGGEKPEAAGLGARVCWCGYTVNANLETFTQDAWNKYWPTNQEWIMHVYNDHFAKGEKYTDYTDKYPDGTEIEHKGGGGYRLDVGYPAYGSETQNPRTRVCQCGFTLNIGDPVMTPDECHIWNWHVQSHSDPDNASYTDKYSDGTETTGSGLDFLNYEGHVFGHDGREPLGISACWCGYTIAHYYKYNEEGYEYEADFEDGFLSIHMSMHLDKGEPSNYSTMTWSYCLSCLKSNGCLPKYQIAVNGQELLPRESVLVDPWVFAVNNDLEWVKAYTHDDGIEPDGVYICDCGYAQLSYDRSPYGARSEGYYFEQGVWNEHRNQHRDKGESFGCHIATWRGYLTDFRMGNLPEGQTLVDPWVFAVNTDLEWANAYTHEDGKKPHDVLVCDCGYVELLYFTTSGEESLFEWSVWNEHYQQHKDNGENFNFYGGTWMNYLTDFMLGKLPEGQTLVDPWNLHSDDKTGNDTDDGTGEVPETGTEAEGAETEPEKTEPARPVKFCVCYCGLVMPIYDVDWLFGGEEHEIWQSHTDNHVVNGDDPYFYTHTYEETLALGIIVENTDGTWELGEGYGFIPEYISGVR